MLCPVTCDSTIGFPVSSSCLESTLAMSQEEKQEPAVEKAPYAELQIEDEQPHDDALPAPATAPTQRGRLKVPAAAIIPVWIVLSSAVIIYNNHLYNAMQFRYPVFLVTWHLTFAVSLSLVRSPLVPR